MDIIGIIITGANLVLGIGGAVLVGRVMRRTTGQGSLVWWISVLVGIYLAESFAVAASMASQILSVVLAFVWAAVVGKWLRTSGAGASEARKAGAWFAVYSGLPALSLVLIPVIAAYAGRNIFSAQDGLRLGIPTFFPWPFTTILGFFGTAAVGAFLLKLLITTTGIRRTMAGGQ